MSRRPVPLAPHDEPRRRTRVAVVIGHPGIGDMVWHQPILEAIARNHGAPVTLFARPTTQSAALFSECADVAEVVLFERRHGREYLQALFDMVGELRRRRFDVAYVLNRRPNLAIACMLAGIPERYGFGAPGQRPFLNRGRWAYDGAFLIGGGAVIQCRLLLERNGLAKPAEAPVLEASPAGRYAARAKYGAAPRPWMALGVTCNAEDRRWVPRHFAELAARLQAKWGGTVFIHGGPHHRLQVDDVLEHLPADAPRIIDLSTHGLPFDQVMGLLAESDVFIGNDSGPLNVSTALGVPSYGLFGSAAPHESLSPRIRAILPAVGEPDLETGMERVSVDHVMESVDGVLAEAAERRALDEQISAQQA
jgi:heptosyltransferase II